MAKKDPYLSTIQSINKDSNKTSLQIQKLVNSANTLQMKYNTSEAQKARAWQERMSKNSHQYEVADLKKAGLNPVLSANQGASSYTTSSASADPESGANAAASLKGAQMSALTNLESSRMSSKATMDAAKMSADAMQQAAYTSALATKYASDNSLKASKYKADLDYKASKYHTDKSYEASKYAADQSYAIAVLDNDTQRWKVKNAPQSTWAGVVDKYAGRTGLLGSDRKAFKALFADPHDFLYDSSNFTNKGKMTKSNFKLSSSGRENVGNTLKGILNIKNNSTNQRAYVKAAMFHDKKALKYITNQMHNPKPAGGR